MYDLFHGLALWVAHQKDYILHSHSDLFVYRLLCFPAMQLLPRVVT